MRACVYERSGILTSARAHEKKSPPMIARLTNISGGSDLFRVGEAGGRRALSVVEAVVAAALRVVLSHRPRQSSLDCGVHACSR